ncbi:MAG TPA: class I adenylate-forming enzyme family protein, partial [Thermoanaerobaculia bacterium]|nr:class I adenylate-forming enzyme family protein [Thermoanaerobaculia bacterium]
MRNQSGAVCHPDMLARFESDLDALALIDGATGAHITRGQLLSRAAEIADQLALPAGSLLPLQLPNSADFVATFIAALKKRLVVMPIDRDMPRVEVDAVLAHFGKPVLPREARMIKLTSGSTGKPKGIVASEANLIADCENICSTMGITPDDLNLGAIPFSHSYGFSNLVTPLLLQGTPIVISNDYLPESLLALSNRYRCTVAPLIPMVYEHLSQRLETIRTFISAGAPLSPSTSRRFRERFGADIHTFYGCSECGGITYDRAGAAVERGTVGSAMDGVSLSFTNNRLVIRGRNVSLGYLLDATTFVPFEDGTFIADDLAHERSVGEIVEIVLTGRASDLINTAGKKVNPREVEAVILQIDGVRQA